MDIAKKNVSYVFEEKEGNLYYIENQEKTILNDIRRTIIAEIPRIETKAYADSIITVQLEMARDLYGKKCKDQLIDEFSLEKYGWEKNTTEVRRKTR